MLRHAVSSAILLISGSSLCLADLDLGALVQPLPADARMVDSGFHVWCGAPTKGADGRYHLYYSRWPLKVGFAPGWAIHSEIAYAVSDKPLGPYRFVNVALPARGAAFWDGSATHNPNVLQSGGRFYLFYMGNRGDGNYPVHRNNQRVGVAVAEKPEGPWKRFDQPVVDVSPDEKAFDSLCVTNPAAAVRPDGGILLIYKAVEKQPGKVMGGRVRYGAAVAEKPEGPYVRQPGRIFEAPEKDSKHWMLAEDPFVWFDATNDKCYYAVARDVVGTFTGSSGGIALFQSADGFDWKPASHPKVLASRFALAEGGLSRKNLERPALLLEEGVPTVLFGATDGYGKSGEPSRNVQIPLRPARN